MDWSALLTPIYRLVGNIEFLNVIEPVNSLIVKRPRSYDTFNPIANDLSVAMLDRAMGCITAFGITIISYKTFSGLRRLYSGNNETIDEENDHDLTEKEKNKVVKLKSSVWALVYFIIQGVVPSRILRIIGVNYFWGSDGFDSSSKKDLETLHGSCHCCSVMFTLKAPCYIEARDCEGKIRYPHFLTKSENFQLSSGSSHLSVYYVNLDSDEPTSKLMPPQKEKTKMAAHAFCNRCGVHILRAPDSKSDIVEVNVSCLDALSNFNEDKRSKRNVKMKLSFSQGNQCMGSGKADLIQFQKLNEECDSEDESNRKDQFSNNERHHVSMQSKQLEKSVENTALNLSSTHTSEDLVSNTSESNFSSTSSNSGSSVTIDTDVIEQTLTSQDSIGDNTSLLSLSSAPLPIKPLHIDKLPRSKSLSLSAPGKAVMRDQLKHYMERHVSTASHLPTINKKE